MKLRKALLVLLMVAMLVSLFGCGSAGTTSSSAPAVESSKMEATAEAATSASATPAAVAENLPVRYVMPGSGPNNRDAVMADVNKTMLADGYNLTLTPVYIPWDAWVDKVNIMLSTGEEFELLHIMEDWVGTGVYQGRGALQPLEGVIASSAPGLKDRFDPILWACATVGGSIYSIPAYWRDASGDGEGLITMRKDKLDAAGLQVPTSIDALITTEKALQASWGGSVKP